MINEVIKLVTPKNIEISFQEENYNDNMVS